MQSRTESQRARDALAPTPPMGWNSWNAYRTRISEQIILRNARALVDSGMRDAGYRYVVVDDGWQAPYRGADGRLVADADRFPHGIGWLAGQVHDLGLQFGLYASPGHQTCAMIYDDYTGLDLGSYGHEQDDIDTFAAWGVDYLKYDWCQAERGATGYTDHEPVFRRMRECIDRTARPIVYSISEYGQQEPWLWAADVANLWRTTQDIRPTWSSIVSIVAGQRGHEVAAGPGHWNDPDMLQVGNGDLTASENRAHFGLWALLAAPLMSGNELFSMDDATRDVLCTPGVVAIDQDPLGEQCRELLSAGPVTVFGRALSGGRTAIGILNASDDATVTARLDAGRLVVESPSGHFEVACDMAADRLVDAWTGNPCEGTLHVDPHDLGLVTG